MRPAYTFAMILANITKDFMELLKKQIDLFHRAVKTLDNIVAQAKELDCSHEYYGLLNDGCIKRFQYTSAEFLRAVKKHLEEYHGIFHLGNTKEIAREAARIKFISDKEHDEMIFMINDRNRIHEAYEENIAAQINKKLPEYSVFMKNIVNRIEESRKKIDNN